MVIEIVHAELPEGDPNVVPWKMYSSLAIDYNRRGWELERIKKQLAVAVAALEYAPPEPDVYSEDDLILFPGAYLCWYNGPRQAALGGGDD